MDENNDFNPGEPPSSLIKPPKPSWKAKLLARLQALKPKLRQIFNRKNVSPEAIRQSLHENLPKLKKSLRNAIQNFDPQSSYNKLSRTIQERGMSRYGIPLTVTLSLFFLSDILALMVGHWIPEAPVARPARVRSSTTRPRSIGDYQVVFSRNLFSSAGLIPGEEDGTPGSVDLGGAPTRTTLPLALVGTLILSDERKSIATIEDKAASLVYPVQVEDEVPNKMTIIKIEARKVIFLNVVSGRREFVDLAEDAASRISMIPMTRPSGPGIEKLAPNQFNVSRNEVDKALADFNNILTQARAVPNIENGVANGYKLFQIVPGSIYDKLGLVNGDLITSLNGEAINDPGKAFEMLSQLKTASHLELGVKKDNKQSTYSYDIR